jgi:hypothetical protein
MMTMTIEDETAARGSAIWWHDGVHTRRNKRKNERMKRYW